MRINKDDIQCRVLITKNGKNNYDAHALEFDLVSSGNTEQEAISKLQVLIGNHVIFCLESKNIDPYVFPAFCDAFEQWNYCQLSYLKSILSKKYRKLEFPKAIVMSFNVEKYRKKLARRNAKAKKRTFKEISLK